jgi:hypothetical protein
MLVRSVMLSFTTAGELTGQQPGRGTPSHDYAWKQEEEERQKN